MNTFVIALFALIAGASAAAIQEPPIPILSQTQDASPDGSFSSSYETANGIIRQESGVLTNPGQKDEAEVIQGRAAWTSPEGIPVELSWIAGPEGVVFTGSHIPVAPPAPEIPIAIQRSLEYNAAHPYKEPAQEKKL